MIANSFPIRPLRLLWAAAFNVVPERQLRFPYQYPIRHEHESAEVGTHFALPVVAEFVHLLVLIPDFSFNLPLLVCLDKNKCFNFESF